MQTIHSSARGGYHLSLHAARPHAAQPRRSPSGGKQCGVGICSARQAVMWIRTMLRCGVPKPLVLMVLLLVLSGGLHCGEAPSLLSLSLS